MDVLSGMPRGATKQFDRTAVLDRAMQLFWEKGYEATGLSELTQRMGIGRQSLYDTFGDKRSLFLEALDHYVGTRVSHVGDLLKATGSPLRNIRRVLAFYERHNTSGNGLGCLVINSAAEFGSPDTRLDEPVRKQVKLLESMYKQAFDAAREAGEIKSKADTLALARAMCSMTFGVCLMGRVGMSKAMVRDVIKMNATIIDSVAVGVQRRQSQGSSS